jgi:AAA+ ATPase superfamily predicted ATPase
VKAKRPVLILGPDKSGKSSLLLQIAEKLRQHKNTPIIFSSSNCIDAASYIRRNLAHMLSAYPETFHVPKELFSLSVLELDKKISELKIDDAAKDALKLLLMFEHDDKIDRQEVIRTFFSFPSLLAETSRSGAVFLVDDAENLSNLKLGEAQLSIVFELMKSIKDSTFIFASPLKLPVEVSETIELHPFSIDAVRQFMKDHSLSINEAALSTVYNITGGVPFYLSYFARLISLSGANTSDSVAALLDDALSNELHVYYSEKLKLLSPKELPILFCMAEHSVNTPSRISKLLNYSQTNVRRFLSIMEEKGFVTLRERGVFEIHDPVFRKWLEQEARK